MDDLQSILLNWYISKERRGEKFGTLGKIVSGSWVVETGDGRVWVTLDDGTALKVVNKAVARKPGIKVIVKPNRDGEMEIQGVQSAQTAASVGNSGPAIANLETPPHQHFIGSGLEDPVESRRFMPGLLHAYSGLTLYIESFPFRYNGVDYRWPGGTYDISGDLPVTAGYFAWVKVGIDPATNTAVAGTSTEFPLRILLSLADLDDIDFATAGYIPCGGVIVQEGQTASPLEADFAESRFMPSSGGAGSTSPWTTNSNVVNLVTDTDTVTIGSATAGGKLFIDGDADEIQLQVQANATQTALLAVFENSAGTDQVTISGTGGLNVNEAGNDADSHVEGDNDATLTYWDAGNDRVAVGTSAPDSRFLVVGRADEPQLAVKGNATQNQPLVEFRNSASTVLHKVLGTGHIEPGADNTYNIGSATAREAQIWGVSFLGDKLGTRVKNTSGSTANANHVGYITYTAGSGAEYKTTTTANLNAAWCVVIVGGANNADIYVARSGVVTIELTANCSAGDFLATSTTAGRAATLGTTMRPEMFAIALTANGGGAGGTCTARLYCYNAPPVYIGNANDIYGHTGVSTQAFTSTISGAPSATSVVYGAVATGAENVIVPSAAGQIGLARLWNTTRNTYRLITAVNTGTNTITTVSTTDAWANGDNLTIESQTTTTGAAFKVTEIDLNNANNNNTVVPLLARAIFLNMYQLDTGAAGTGATYVHEFSTYATSKLLSVGNQNATAYNNVFIQLPLIGQVFGITQVASGAGTGQGYYRLYGYVEAAP